MHSFEMIDLSAAIDTIRQKYGVRYHLSPDALWEVAALWGVTPETGGIRQYGGFTDLYERTRLDEGGCWAEIKLVQTPSQIWAMSTSHSTRISGGGCSPSIWNRTAFLSHRDARLAAIDELLAWFKREAESMNSCSSEANRRDIAQMIALLEAEKMPQLALFDL